MIIYEVNLTIEPAIISEFKDWLTKHVTEILSLPGFKTAHIYQELTESNHITVRYELDSENSLNSYLKKDAPKMRQSAIAKFGDKFSATRKMQQLLVKVSA